jgi:hypothetical protein
MATNAPIRRKALTPGVLYRILNAELHARRPHPCQCRMPLPFIVEAGDGATANWRIPPPTRCAHGCHVVIADIVKVALLAFDVHDPGANPRRADATQER